jgi:hypothetical protein
MNDATPEEIGERVIALAQLLIKAGEALDRSDYATVQRLMGDGARQARVLVLMSKTDT